MGAVASCCSMGKNDNAGDEERMAFIEWLQKLSGRPSVLRSFLELTEGKTELTKEEFLDLLKAKGYPREPESAFKALDADSDEKITVTDIEALQRKGVAMASPRESPRGQLSPRATALREKRDQNRSRMGKHAGIGAY